MLKVDRPLPRPLAVAEPTPPGTARIPSIWTAFSRYWRSSTALVTVSVALGVVYAMTSTPLYTASTEVLIDARRLHTGEGGGNRSLAELGMDSASIDSQVSVLGSEAMAVKVIKELHLENDASYAAPTTLPARVLQDLKRALKAERPPAADVGGIRLDILDGFAQRFDVKRVQQTYVLSLSFSDTSAAHAAAIVNTFAALYANEQIESAIRSKDVAASWLKDRLSEATQEVAAAEQALRSFRIESAEQLAASTGAASGAAGAEMQDRGRDLERALNTRKSLYEALVQQAQSAISHQTMPVSSVSVLNDARPPLRPSRPNFPLTIAVSLIGGLAAALALGTVRSMRESTFQVPSDVEGALGLRYLGGLPRMPRKWSRSLAAGGRRGLPALPAGTLGATAFMDTLRAAKVAADMATQFDGMSVIGVVSALPDEGRSTVAAGLADLFAAGGRRVLLIDTDLRRPSLSLQCPQGRRAGLIEVMEGSADLDDCIVREARCVDVLPAFGGSAEDSTGTMLEIGPFDDLLSRLHGVYQTVILDLPPLSCFTEALAITPKIDGFLMVLAWGSTRRDVATEALRATPVVAERTFGVVLNKADLKASSRLKRDAADRFHLAGVDHPRSTAA